MTTLVTGAAGFIGYHVCRTLLDRGEEIIGLDNLNPYYDVRLKQARIEQLEKHPQFTWHLLDISERDRTLEFFKNRPQINKIVHLAAQAGVRYSLLKPFAYADSNLLGHLSILESCRYLPDLVHLVYASSSSVYGANQKMPFSVEDPVDHPISLYAATKRAGELMSYTYSHLHGVPATGLRFFTVYGPWGRPDMSAFLFTKAILEDQEIPVYNHGDMRRNFTYIDDIIQGVLGCLEKPPNMLPSESASASVVPHRVYNIGNNRSESLMDFIKTLEETLGKKAKTRFEELQPGDVKETIADITKTEQDFGFSPKTNIQEGLQRFVEWYRSFYAI